MPRRHRSFARRGWGEHIILLQDEEALTEPYLVRLSGSAAAASNELLENCRLLKATEGAHTPKAYAIRATRPPHMHKGSV